ncbi:hypothetical protein COI61_27935 [Bacillus cereus]|nr:hypothetical protein COI61_27935 [Bacillus cereus]
MKLRLEAIKELEDILETQKGSRVVVVTTGGSLTSGVVAGVDDDILTLTRTVTQFQIFSFATQLAFIPLFEIVTLLNEVEPIET